MDQYTHKSSACVALKTDYRPNGSGNAQVIGMRGGMHGVERVEADHDGHEDGELDPGGGGDGAQQEGVEDDGDRGQPGHEGHGKAAGRVLLAADDVHRQCGTEPAPAQQPPVSAHRM